MKKTEEKSRHDFYHGFMVNDSKDFINAFRDKISFYFRSIRPEIINKKAVLESFSNSQENT